MSIAALPRRTESRLPYPQDVAKTKSDAVAMLYVVEHLDPTHPNFAAAFEASGLGHFADDQGRTFEISAEDIRKHHDARIVDQIRRAKDPHAQAAHERELDAPYRVGVFRIEDNASLRIAHQFVSTLRQIRMLPETRSREHRPAPRTTRARRASDATRPADEPPPSWRSWVSRIARALRALRSSR